MERKLLHTPEGVRDIYGEECADKLHIQDKMHKVLIGHGFEDIQTPSFEFFDIFNKERGSVESKNMFKFFDREGNTLVLRPDMTPSIARCASKYFENIEVPIRLCYMGNTFINKSSYQGRLKETTQLGCELIGDYSEAADAEILATVIESLLSVGLKEFQLEIGHVGYFKGIIKASGIDSDTEEELRRLIQQKNFFGVEELAGSCGLSSDAVTALFMLPQFFGSADILDEAGRLVTNKESLEAIEHLYKVYDLMKAYGYEKYISFDLGMLSELTYYTGIIFRAVTYDVGEPVAAGGRYDELICQFGKPAPSIGFSVTVDLVLTALKRQNIEINQIEKPILIAYFNDETVAAINMATGLRKEGKNVCMLAIRPDMTRKSLEELCKKYNYSQLMFVESDSVERFRSEE